MDIFVGRDEELRLIKALDSQPGSKIIVIKGRRRIGKSRLIFEFAKTIGSNRRFLHFSALPPAPEVTAQSQRDYFAAQLSKHLSQPIPAASDWHETLWLFSEQLISGDCILFDEISWMEGKDGTFISKLKAWWDILSFSDKKITLFFCGSITPWIEENILNSTGFVGRISLTITLAPLSIPESSKLLVQNGWKGSPFETYALLSVVGGIPWYLKQINCAEMAQENIKRLCFSREGLLVREFETIFNDLFNGRGATYRKILSILSMGPGTALDIRTALSLSNSGTLSTMLKHLVICGFIEEHPQWSLKAESLGKQSLYRISDPYIRFYLTHIEPAKTQIMGGNFPASEIFSLPGFEGILGLQIEQLLLQNRPLLRAAIGASAHEILFDGPYRQTKTARAQGCQIDYLIQTRTKNMFVCEFKCKQSELGKGIVTEMTERLNRFSTPRGSSVVPVLFHLGGVSDSVLRERFFYRIIDIADFLYKKN